MIALRLWLRQVLAARRRAASAAVAAALLAALLSATLLAAAGYRRVPLAASAAAAGESRQERARRAELERRLAAQAPRGVWVVVDTFDSRLTVRRGGELLREAVCSTGSGLVLRHRASGQEWVFDTPIGERRVERKAKNPIWVKPDWAFIEEGYAPPADPRERFDDVSLGDYGIYLGDGYLIHGTLFRSLLGQKVTHGCIRLGDEDLEYLYRLLRVGDRVVLY